MDATATTCWKMLEMATTAAWESSQGVRDRGVQSKLVRAYFRLCNPCGEWELVDDPSCFRLLWACINLPDIPGNDSLSWWPSDENLMKSDEKPLYCMHTGAELLLI